MEKTKQKQITDFLINNGVIIVMFISGYCSRSDYPELFYPE